MKWLVVGSKGAYCVSQIARHSKDKHCKFSSFPGDFQEKQGLSKTVYNIKQCSMGHVIGHSK